MCQYAILGIPYSTVCVVGSSENILTAEMAKLLQSCTDVTLFVHSLNKLYDFFFSRSELLWLLPRILIVMLRSENQFLIHR